LSITNVAVTGMVGYLVNKFGNTQSIRLSNCDSFIYLFCLSSTLGLQIWVTFVAGLTMKKILPRHQFGEVQSNLFPRYFFLTTLNTFGSLSIYSKLYPITQWKNDQATLGYILAGSFILNALNSTYFSVKTVKNMQKMHEIEKRAGVGLTTVGKIMLESKIGNDPEYRDTTSKFNKFHGISMVANILSVAATVSHIYFLSYKQYSIV